MVNLRALNTKDTKYTKENQKIFLTFLRVLCDLCV